MLSLPVLMPLALAAQLHTVGVLVDNPAPKSSLPLYLYVTLACKVQGKAIVS